MRARAALLLLPPMSLARSRTGYWSEYVWGRLSVPNVTRAVQRALSTPSPLVPPGAVVLSEANEYHAPLLVLQHARLRELHAGPRAAFLGRLVAVCWGAATVRLLRQAGFARQCVQGPSVPPSNMQARLHLVARNL